MAVNPDEAGVLYKYFQAPDAMPLNADHGPRCHGANGAADRCRQIDPVVKVSSQRPVRQDPRSEWRRNTSRHDRWDHRSLRNRWTRETVARDRHAQTDSNEEMPPPRAVAEARPIPRVNILPIFIGIGAESAADV